MMTLMVQDQPDAGRSPEIALARLVDGLGNDRFGPALASYLHGLCGADHFAAFRLGHDELREVAACCVQPERTARDRVESYVKQGLWKHDPAMTEAQRCVEGAAAAIIHVDFSDHGYDDLRPRVYPHVRDRILLCGRGANGAFGLSVLRADSHSPFAHEAIEKLGQAAELLVAMLAKHANVCQSRPNVAQALTSLPEIELHRRDQPSAAARGRGVRPYPLRPVLGGHRTGPDRERGNRQDLSQARLPALGHRQRARAADVVPGPLEPLERRALSGRGLHRAALSASRRPP